MVASFALAFSLLLGADLAADLAALTRRFEAYEEELDSRLEKAGTDAARRAIRAEDPVQLFGPDFLELGLRAKGSEVAPRALMWVIRLEGLKIRGTDAKGAAGAPETAAQRALLLLVGEHVASPSLVELPEMLSNTFELGEARVREALEKLRAGSPHRPIQAAAQLELARLLRGAPGTDAEGRAKARRLFQELREKFADVKDAGGRSYAERAESFLFEIDRLQIGMLAPDFEAVDENGTPFKVSDYRGKVVVLDFWGFW